MPSTPTSVRASLTASSLKGLMMAVISFMGIWGYWKKRQRRGWRKPRGGKRHRMPTGRQEMSNANAASARAFVHLDVQFLELLGGDRGRTLGHEVLGLLRLRKGDDVPD